VDDELMMLGITLAVTEHRRRITALLDRLDESRRDAVASGAAALEAGTVDVGTLLVYSATACARGMYNSRVPSTRSNRNEAVA
jgi:hypothetical protein